MMGISVMMPHPERTFLTKQYSWAPKEWGKSHLGLKCLIMLINLPKKASDQELY
ncbi:MAG: hypothetical protein CM15mP12_8870 [Gammaproteobacteria bacterium]|nr:MAG: hypothetical protein CM15mP12_8870 [Gammaproteobacteria bacterium]